MGSRLPNVTLLYWAQQKYALVGCDGWVIGRLVEQGLHHQSYHTQMHTTQHQRIFSFPSLPGLVVGEMLSAARYVAVGMVGRPSTHVVRDAFL